MKISNYKKHKMWEIKKIYEASVKHKNEYKPIYIIK